VKIARCWSTSPYVTNVQYNIWAGLSVDPAAADLPKTGVTWHEARDYCIAHGGRLPLSNELAGEQFCPLREWCEDGQNENLKYVWGGSFLSLAWDLRAANRLSLDPVGRYRNIGFRCVPKEIEECA
jgi:formylglycine-generating enzyme required for sulfatase activity